MDHITLQNYRVSRRRFMQTSASGFCTTLFFSSTQVWAAETQIDTFMKASSVLSGIELDRSYIQLGEHIWSALSRNATKKDLAQWNRLIQEMAKLPLSSSETRIKRKLKAMGIPYNNKAKKLARVWYTGRIWHPKGPNKGFYEVIDYDDALVWQACTFTKPPTTCGGHFGYWQHPYSGKA